ncbi:VOC family protein [Croceivirga thetidis]|uniref:VOC family protein n=1 Tax=Croceivirga thetidis TaxID=2721623 RepID=A0ABX1GTB9_9FLAO|nr:VOC family protein [Croceivirga thetidis]NKI32256.1 VOC family protein [Croceivirga thetidis]
MKTTTFLTFVGDQCGKAKEAIDLYISVFPNSEWKKTIAYTEGEGGGTPELIKFGIFTLNGTEYMVSESNYDHAWSFSPAVSIYIESDSEAELVGYFDKLSGNGGMVMVPFDSYEEGDYGFGKKYGWCQDSYGINWQFLLSE